MYGVGLVLALVLSACSQAADEDAGNPLPSRTTAQPPSPAPVQGRLPESTARALESDLTSGDPDRVADAVVVPPGADLDPEFVDGMTGLGLVLDTTTFRTIDDTTAQVEADVDGDPWVVYLVLVAGAWMISATEPVVS